jgi:manganese-dependent inorganic pyrophosphatase
MHNIPRDEVFVIGHKNPDTDSICSAIAYANLKNKAENKYIPKRAGKLSKETEFVLDYFDVKAPELINDVDIQVSDIAYRIVDGVSGNITMKTAFEIMQKNDATTLPIVEKGKIKGIVTVGDIAEAYIQNSDANILHVSKTRYRDITETIEGKILCGDKNHYAPEGKIIIGAAHVGLMEQYINANDIVLLSDRKEAQIMAIEKGAALLVVCLVDKVSEDVLTLAEKKGCGIIATKNDTYTVARLIGQSVPVKYFMIRNGIMTFHEDDSVENLKSTMAKTRVRYFPVVDKNEKYLGLVSRRNYINTRKKQVILVDHNERTQSVDHIDKADIVEIIDHHRIANVETFAPVYFRNQPVGCTCTIVYQMYKEQGVVPEKWAAGLMCAAILSDTLLFKSPTCTPVDVNAANELADIAGIDVTEFAMEMFGAGSNLNGKSMAEVLHQDFKKFDIEDKVIAIGQITSINIKELDKIKKEMYEYLAGNNESGWDVVIFVMTNILDDSSGMLTFGKGCEDICERAFGEAFVDHYAYLKGIVSRKKQIVPAIIKALQE